MTTLQPSLDFTQITVRHPAGYEVILYRQGDTVHAYRNSCPHIGVGLDYGNGSCLLDDGVTLLCALHGATFEADSGLCTGGPCAGRSLTRVAVRVEGDAVVCDGVCD
jgi:nitrite reductase/ring-hydroxylating ferredoxin subunit